MWSCLVFLPLVESFWMKNQKLFASSALSIQAETSHSALASFLSPISSPGDEVDVRVIVWYTVGSLCPGGQYTTPHCREGEKSFSSWCSTLTFTDWIVAVEGTVFSNWNAV